MAMAIDDAAMMDFSGHSAAAAADEFGGGCCEWSDWSPVVDWDAVHGSGRDGFHDLMESMLEDGTGPHPHHLPPPQWCDSPPSVHDVTNGMEGDGTDGHDFKGLRLVHLLMAAAEALSGKGENLELAQVILIRLKELVSPPSVGGGTSMERLAGHFTDALQGMLEGVKAAAQSGGKHSAGGSPHRDEGCYSQTDVLVAFQLLQDMSPHVKFGHFTANQAILEAVGHERRVHVVDYDIMEGVQWASLMQALVSQKGGRPSPHLRITALSRAGSGRRWTATVQDTGRHLATYAKSIGQPFSFHQCRLDPEETFRPAVLKLVQGEALVFNCMLHLPHSAYHTPGSVASFLSGARALSPRLVTLAEEEAGPTGGRDGFMGWFMDSLQHYSAVYDSLEAGFPMPDRARALVERVFLGPRIAASVALMHRARPGEEEEENGPGKLGSWGEWLGAEGYRSGRVSFSNHYQAKLLVGLFNDGYTVEEVAGNTLVLGWKSRRLLSASIWTSSSEDPDSLN